jgi:cytochrome P450
MPTSSSKSRRPPGPREIIPGRTLLRFRRDSLGYLTQLSRQYGDIAAFKVAGQQYYLVNNPDYIRDILVTRASNFMKGPALQRAKAVLGEGLLTSEGDFHRRQRRLVQPAFHPKRVETYAQVMCDSALDTCRRWQGGGRGNEVEMHAEMMRLALIIAGRTLFGTMMEDQAAKIGQAMHTAISSFNRAVLPWGRLLTKLPLPSNRKIVQAHTYLMDTIRNIITQRREASGEHDDRGDLLSILLNAHDAEEHRGPMTDPQLLAECYTLLTAGHETTANALTFTWYLLAKHPDVQGQLHAELDAALGSRPPGPQDVDRLPLARMIIAESMRLYPPAWTLGRQTQESFDIGPFTLRAKSTVLMSQWVTHRDPRFWPEPEKFLPQRWATETDRPRYAYFPFGGGVRQCIGESFAWTEAILLLATIAQRYRVQLVTDAPVPLQPTITLRPKNGMPLKITRRLK